jgi:hypothetical protein
MFRGNIVRGNIVRGNVVSGNVVRGKGVRGTDNVPFFFCFKLWQINFGKKFHLPRSLHEFFRSLRVSVDGSVIQRSSSVAVM